MPDKVYWTTKNGKKIDVDLMDENHLRNTLKMILRAREARKKSASIDNEDKLRIYPRTKDDCDATEIDLY